MIKDEKALTAYLSKVKMTDEAKLKDRDNKDKRPFLTDIE